MTNHFYSHLHANEINTLNPQWHVHYVMQSQHSGLNLRFFNFMHTCSRQNITVFETCHDNHSTLKKVTQWKLPRQKNKIKRHIYFCIYFIYKTSNREIILIYNNLWYTEYIQYTLSKIYYYRVWRFTKSTKPPQRKLTAITKIQVSDLGFTTAFILSQDGWYTHRVQSCKCN